MRNASTYRHARRDAWREAWGGIGNWAHFNTGTGRADTEFSVGTPPSRYRPSRRRPSKYMPHTGKKQRAKGAMLTAAAQ